MGKIREKKRCDGPPFNAPSAADSGGEDQHERSYYYDDAHGYEVYCPDEDGEETSDQDQPDQQKGAVIPDDPEK